MQCFLHKFTRRIPSFSNLPSSPFSKSSPSLFLARHQSSSSPRTSSCPSRNPLLSDAALNAQLNACLSCEKKPCQTACPVDCSPADFIFAARTESSDTIQPTLAAAHILSQNPLGGSCGSLCPHKFCVAACSRSGIDAPIDIPRVQATLVSKARKKWKEEETKNGNSLLKWAIRPHSSLSKKHIAVIGGGPSGLACAAKLIQEGNKVTLFDKDGRDGFGGALASTIPESRFPSEILEQDVQFLVDKVCGTELDICQKNVSSLDELGSSFDACVIAVGLWKPLTQENFEGSIFARDFLKNYKKGGSNVSVEKRHVAIIGGGPVAVDVATTAYEMGASKITLIVMESQKDMPLEMREREWLIDVNATIVPDTRVVRLKPTLVTSRANLSTSDADSVLPPEQEWPDVSVVVTAIGDEYETINEGGYAGRVFYAGDVCHGASTVVEAVASGKSAALQVLRFFDEKKETDAVIYHNKPGDGYNEPSARRCSTPIDGYNFRPCPLSLNFFDFELESPFVLSASPLTDSLEVIEKAYEQGWAGVVLKTAFDGESPVHVPSEYMTRHGKETWGNCDNVSARSIRDVIEDIKILKKKWPGKWTAASTGGPVSGNDQADRLVWGSNTRALEDAGACAIEYSLSCPQGGEGAEGDIVSQSSSLSSKVVEWVLSEARNPSIPKIFKLTSATPIPLGIVQALQNGPLAKYPDHKVAITMANSFPAGALREVSRCGGSESSRWPYKAVVVGLSGSGVTPLSYLALSKISESNITISGNGGVMDSKSAAHFLALGCSMIQICTMAEQYGLGVVSHLEEGLSHLLQEHGYQNAQELVGDAKKDPIADFLVLPPAPQAISSLTFPDLCVQCGNCHRCPYGAIHDDPSTGMPSIDPELCVGCGMCALKCPTDALSMVQRPHSFPSPSHLKPQQQRQYNTKTTGTFHLPPSSSFIAKHFLSSTSAQPKTRSLAQYNFPVKDGGDLLLKNGIVVTPEDLIENCDILIREGHIKKIGKDLDDIQSGSGVETFDASGCLLHPGFVCGHGHFYSLFARGMPTPIDEPPSQNFLEVLQKMWWRIDRSLTLEDCALSARLGALGSVRCGTTTVIDHHSSYSAIENSLDVIASECNSAGIRIITAFEVSDRNGKELCDQAVEENVRFAKRIFAEKNSMVGAMFGLHAPFTLNDDTLTICSEHIRELNKEAALIGRQYGAHIHLCEDVGDNQFDKESQPGKRLTDAGIVSNHSLLAHCVHLGGKFPSDLSTVCQHHPTIAHCPSSNANNAVGIANNDALEKAGATVALGTDGMYYDMINEFQRAGLFAKLKAHSPSHASANKCYEWLQNSSQIASSTLGVRVGELVEGAVGDVVVLSYNAPTKLTLGNLPWHMSFGMGAQHVRKTVVNGIALCPFEAEKEAASIARELAPGVWKRFNDLYEQEK